jgi:hypothetical protein
MYSEAHGDSLKKVQLDRGKRPHHLALFLSHDSSDDDPKWILESHGSDTDPAPESEEFSGEDGGELLTRLCEAILGRTIKGRRQLRKRRQSTIQEESNNE